MTTQEAPGMLTAALAAKLLGCSYKAMIARCERGSIPAIKAGGRWLLPGQLVHAMASGDPRVTVLFAQAKGQAI